MATTNREAWLAERRSGIGGSDAAAILGFSPWATPVTIWLDKTGRSAPKPENAAMKYGTYFENYVADLYSEETGRAVQRYNKMIHDGCLLGNVDRLVVPEGKKMASHKGEIISDTILECKTSGKEWGGEVPLNYMCQVMHYLGLAPKVDRADIAVLFRASLKFEVFHIERDNEAISAMQERLRDWWERFVVGDTPPPPTNEEDCKSLWARSNPGKSVTANDEAIAAILDYRSAKAALDTAKTLADACKDKVLISIADAENLVDAHGNALATWKSAKESVKVDWEAVARELGATDEQIAKHTKVSAGTRRFLLKETNIDSLILSAPQQYPQISHD